MMQLDEPDRICVSPDDWIVVLFYQYCELENPSTTCQEQLKICQNLNLLGRVRVSSEGINGTLGGTSSSIREYISTVDSILEFEATSKPIHWKLGGLSKENLLSKGDNRLKTLSVKVAKEVVSLDLSEIATRHMIKAGPGKHLTPQEFHNILAASLHCTGINQCMVSGSSSGSSSSRGKNYSVAESVSYGNAQGQIDDAEKGSRSSKELLVLDVRNYYETRIGRFQLIDNDGLMVPTIIDPHTRQVLTLVVRKRALLLDITFLLLTFLHSPHRNSLTKFINLNFKDFIRYIFVKFSDFAKFVDTNVETFKGKQILMYCTGGVRCERASAYMKSKGVDDVSQLSGGIHAYQEAFPDGGYFHGKNFVFDPRIAVPSMKNCDEVIGVCCLCFKLYDDYTKQCRCSICRVLVLICDDCYVPISESLHLDESSAKKSKIPYFCSQCSGQKP